MTDIVLNVKSLVVKNHSDATRVITVEKSEPGPITGADVQTDADVEVINKDHVLATLTDNVPFMMEMVVENGRGYVPAGEQSIGDHEIGIIPIDAVYSPVTRVRFHIEETRVGQKTNYDKLTMEIWTNGSISPEMALVESAKIFRKHLNPFVQYSELGHRVHSAVRSGGGIGRRGSGSQVEHEPGGVESVGASQQLPGIGKYQHGSRPGAAERRSAAGGPQFRRDDA